MTTTILIIINVFACIAIIGLTLMQQSKGDMGSAFGGGSSQSMFGSRGSANFLSRSTSIMCVIFFASSLALAYVYAQRADSSSVIGNESVTEETTEVVPTDNGVPSIPGVEVVPDASVESAVPTIPDTVSDAIDNVQETGEAAIEAIEDAAEEVPAVPE